MKQQANHDSLEQLAQAAENEKIQARDENGAGEDVSEDKKLDGPNRPST